MMKSIAIVVAIGSLALMGCEDGPDQTYSPSPDGAGNKWNDGKTPGFSDPGTQGFNSQSGGTNAQEICTGEERAKRWAWMVQQLITGSTRVAGIDAVGGDKWPGLTIEEAERGYDDPNFNDPTYGKGHNPGLCQSTPLGDQFGDGTSVNQWGDNGEVWAKYNVNNHKIQWITVFPGYEGTMDFKSRDKKDTFQIKVNSQIRKNNQPFELDWDSPDFNKQATELADALFATFAPELPPEDASTGSCFSNGHCTKTVFSDVAVIRLWGMGMHLWVANPHATQPTPSIFNRIDFRLPRSEPYTFAWSTFKLDSEGPIGLAKGAQKNGGDCKIQLGMTWGDFLKACVDVNADPTKDAVYENKLYGAMVHDTERFFFDSSGVDVDFTDRDLQDPTKAGWFDVVRDDTKPTPNDPATALYVDSATLGPITNDLDPTDPSGETLDYHGSGAVMFEFARLVQTEINRQLKLADPNAVTHDLAAPECLFSSTANGDITTWSPAQNCTGFEGFLTPAPPDPAHPEWDAIRLGVNGVVSPIGLKPGKPFGVWCDDAGDAYAYCGSDANGNTIPYGFGGGLWDASFQRVKAVLGKGKVNTLPAEIRDRRFFWKEYAIAVVKYMRSFATNPNGLMDLSNVTYDPNAIFFDAEGAGQYEKVEYIDRTYASKTRQPLDIEMKADILNGTFYDYLFFQNLYRPEMAVYQSVLENPADGLGQEDNATITNLFGSPVLAAAYYDTFDTNGNPLKTAYQCATETWTTETERQQDLTDCEGQHPPYDKLYVPDLTQTDPPLQMPEYENGKPLLYPYKAAIGGAKSTPFTLGSSHITVEQTLPGLQAAKIKIENWGNYAAGGTKDPYDTSDPTKASAPIEVLVPWLPMQPGVGFSWPLSGTKDKEVESAALDFSGTTVTFNMDVLPADPTNVSPDGTGAYTMLAVETVDFLGDVFLCQDPVTGDLLHAGMYDSVATILDWIDKHPGVYDACGLIVRYSAYNNFPDYIFSTVNGVRLNITQGGGFGRIVDATLFVPGQY